MMGWGDDIMISCGAECSGGFKRGLNLLCAARVSVW